MAESQADTFSDMYQCMSFFMGVYKSIRNINRADNKIYAYYLFFCSHPVIIGNLMMSGKQNGYCIYHKYLI